MDHIRPIAEHNQQGLGIGKGLELMFRVKLLLRVRVRLSPFLLWVTFCF